MPTKIIVPASTVGTGISVNIVNTAPVVNVSAPVCPYTNLSQEQSNIILRDVYVFVASDYPPQTIVNYVSVAAGSPTFNSNNWCFLNCVSANLFKSASFTPPSTYAYVNKPQTFAKITNCFPEFPLESGGSGGSASSFSRPDLERLLELKIQQIDDLMDMLNYTGDDIQALIGNLISNFGQTLASFLSRIAMAAEHLSEIIFADITKRIGTAIAWIAKAWKSIKDMFNAASNYVLVAGETTTDSGGGTIGHFKKAIQDAYSTLSGFLTDVLCDAGRYIDDIGNLLNDMADKLIDLKEIAFMFRALSGMITNFTFTISWQYNRSLEALRAQTYGAAANNSLFNIQASFANAMQLVKTEMAGVLALQEDCSNIMEQLSLLKMDLKAIPAEFKSLIADEKAAFARLRAANAAYLAYVRGDIKNIENQIKSLVKIGVPAKSKLCSSRSNSQTIQLDTTLVKIGKFEIPGVSTT